jgi:hypothetical protein
MARVILFVLGGLGTIASFLALTLMGSAICGVIVMLLWNYLLAGATPIIAGVTFNTISWFQGFLLTWLCAILFKSSGD